MTDFQRKYWKVTDEKSQATDRSVVKPEKKVDSTVEDYRYHKISSTRPEGKGFQEAGGFNINVLQRHSLGMDERDHQVVEEKVKLEVERRRVSVEGEAHKKGYEEGFEKGFKDATEEFFQSASDNLERIDTLVNEFESNRRSVFQLNQDMVVRIAFEVGKQLALKEIKADSSYICKLIEDVFVKYKLKGEIKIIISPKDLTILEEGRPNLAKKFSDFENVKIEVNEAIESGAIFEMPDSVLNATTDKQIERILENILGSET